MSHLRRITRLAVFDSGVLKLCPKVYLFGSCVTSVSPSDIDLLFVFDGVDSAAYALAISFRRLISIEMARQMGLPADIVLLTSAEEAGMDIIKNEEAVKLWP